MGTLIPPVYRTDYEHSVAAARTQLGEKVFAAAWAEGRSMTLDQALAAHGPVTLPRETQPPPPAKSPSTYPAGLTAREVEVLRLVAQSLTDAEIAGQLVISVHTAHNHVKAILSKLSVPNRTAASTYAKEHKLG